jgi:hypothetical protein
MKREIFTFQQGHNITGCCPGHDTWPNDTYRSNRSKRARARDIKKEHRYVRRILNSRLKNETFKVA